MTTKLVQDARDLQAARARHDALLAEQRALNGREPQALVARSTVKEALVVANEAVDLANARALGLDAEPGAVQAAEDAVRKLELQQTNNESVLRGIARRREQLAAELFVAEVAVGRGRARAALPQQVTAESCAEAFADALGHLRVLVEAVRVTLQVAHPGDQRGLREAFDEAQLARWLLTQLAQTGIDLDLAKVIQRGGGVDPETTLSNLSTVLMTLE